MDVYIDQFQHFISSTIQKINQTTQSTENHKLIAITIIATVVLTKIYNVLFDKISPLPLSHRIKHTVFTNVRKLPFIGTEIAKQVAKAKSDVWGLPTFQLEKENENKTAATYQTEICQQGRSEKDILNDLKVMSGVYDFGGDDGIGSENQKVLFSGSIYSGEKELAEMWSKIFKTHCWSNPLHVDMFKSIRKMEAELIRQTVNLYNGDQKACGIMTSGGTESIFQACVAYRNKYRKEHGWSGSVPTPELVLPVSAHPAFNKACHYLHVKVVPVEIDPVSKKVSVESIRAKINSRTMAVVASAPQYPHGVFDPIAEIAGLAKSMDVPMHVDCCLGGFLVPFANEAGFTSVPIVDFRVSGVTSISCDPHKYGCTPKGTSVIMFSSNDLRQNSYYAISTWPGGLYSTTTPAGSRPGVNAALAWATLQYIGKDGYIKRTKAILELAARLEKIAKKAAGLDVIGTELQTVCFTSKKFNIYHMLDEMSHRGWELQALQFPPSIHIGLTYAHCLAGESFVEKWTKDIIEVATKLDASGQQPASDGSAALYGTAQTIPDRSIVEDTTKAFWDAYYNTE